VPGFLASHQDPSGLTEYQRDAHGRVTGKTQHVNDSPSTPSVFQLQYLYEGGRLRRVTYPSGLVVTYQRQSGRVVGVDVQEPGLLKPTLPFVTSLTYTGLGVPRSWNWLSGDSASRQFDANGRMTGNEFASYTHDAAGQITSITQNLIATTSVSGTASYYLVPLQWNVAYDVRGRVTGFNRTGHGVTYTYDGNSNRLTSSDVRRSDSDLDGEVSGGDTIRTVEQAYDIAAASNRLMGFSKSISTTEAGQAVSSATLSVALQLDAAGSMVHDGLREYVYDEAARLSKVRAASDGESAIVTYLHNAEGQRVFRSEPVAEDVLPNEATLGAGFIEWLRQSFRWLFTPSGSSTSLGMAFVHADGELPQWALLGQYDNGTSAGEGRTEYIWLPLEDGSAIPIGF